MGCIMSIRKILLTHWFLIERVVWKLVQLYVKPLLYMVVMSILLTWNSRSPCRFLVLDEPRSVFQELEEDLFDYYQHCNLGHCLRYGESLFLILGVFSWLTFSSADLVSTCPLSRSTMTLALAVGLVPTMYDYEWKAATWWLLTS